MNESLIERLNNTNISKNNNINNINNIEETNVKDVYEKIANHFHIQSIYMVLDY